MGNVKENFQKVLEECTALYVALGATAVIGHVIAQQRAGNPMYDIVTYRHCPQCEAGQPNLMDTCLVCGSSTIVLEEEEKETISYMMAESAEVKARVEFIIKEIRTMNLDGETVQHILEETGMDDQMRSQLSGEVNPY